MPGSGLMVGDVSVNKKYRPVPSSYGAFSLMEENDIKQTHTQICRVKTVNSALRAKSGAL